MAQPRPSLTLILDIDERLDSEEVRLEINRCYSYVGSTLVRTHPAGEGEPENIMRFLVKLGTRRYLRSADEGADQLWNDVMERWFYNELFKVSNNMKIYNRRQREVGNPDLAFDWIEIELQNGELRALLHCDNASGIDPKASTLLTTLRTAYNEGSLGADIARVLMPAPASWREQEAAGLAAKAERDAQEAAAKAQAAAAARAEAEAAAALAEESFLETPDLVAPEEPAENIEPEPFALDEPDFALDYRMWLIEYADGATRTFDSQTGAFA